MHAAHCFGIPSNIRFLSLPFIPSTASANTSSTVFLSTDQVFERHLRTSAIPKYPLHPTIYSFSFLSLSVIDMPALRSFLLLSRSRIRTASILYTMFRPSLFFFPATMPSADLYQLSLCFFFPAEGYQLSQLVDRSPRVKALSFPPSTRSIYSSNLWQHGLCHVLRSSDYC